MAENEVQQSCNSKFLQITFLYKRGGVDIAALQLWSPSAPAEGQGHTVLRSMQISEQNYWLPQHVYPLNESQKPPHQPAMGRSKTKATTSDI